MKIFLVPNLGLGTYFFLQTLLEGVPSLAKMVSKLTITGVLRGNKSC